MDFQSINWQQLNWNDYLMLSFIGLTFIFGFYRGLVKELLGLVFFALSIWLSLTFYTQVAEMNFLTKIVGSDITTIEKVKPIIAFILIFCSVVVLGKIVSVILTKFLDFTGIGIINRFLGGVFSTVKYGFIVLFFLSILGKFQNTNYMTKFLNNAQLSKISKKAVQFFSEKLPKEFNYFKNQE
ncbi:Colicin V production protein [hydrothermal vent metagenome]|uniref:Colicin V production protein n=1 Tax=hydrothermal vent metagenome TaxID=652676 RepID=A0A1W1CSA0_9ZZZZ